MNESPTSEPLTAPILGGAAAFRLGAGLLVGVALMLALAIFDRQRRARVEGWEELTAVGDRAFFLPPPDSAAPAVVKWEAGVLTVQTAERAKLRDTQMRRAGRAEAEGVTIYQQAAPAPDATVPYYVKVAPSEYLPAK